MNDNPYALLTNKVKVPRSETAPARSAENGPPSEANVQSEPGVVAKQTQKRSETAPARSADNGPPSVANEEEQTLSGTVLGALWLVGYSFTSWTRFKTFWAAVGKLIMGIILRLLGKLFGGVTTGTVVNGFYAMAALAVITTIVAFGYALTNAIYDAGVATAKIEEAGVRAKALAEKAAADAAKRQAAIEADKKVQSQVDSMTDEQLDNELRAKKYMLSLLAGVPVGSISDDMARSTDLSTINPKYGTYRAAVPSPIEWPVWNDKAEKTVQAVQPHTGQRVQGTQRTTGTVQAKRTGTHTATVQRTTVQRTKTWREYVQSRAVQRRYEPFDHVENVRDRLGGE